MKRDRRSHRGRTCDLAGGMRSQVSLARGVLAVLVEEDRLDEQQVSAAQEARESVPVARVVSG